MIARSLLTFAAPITGIACIFIGNPVLGIITLTAIAIVILVRSK